MLLIYVLNLCNICMFVINFFYKPLLFINQSFLMIFNKYDLFAYNWDFGTMEHWYYGTMVRWY